jgi:hypothetical protein
MEYAAGGMLFNEIAENHTYGYTESVARGMVGTVIQVLVHMHNHVSCILGPQLLYFFAGCFYLLFLACHQGRRTPEGCSFFFFRPTKTSESEGFDRSKNDPIVQSELFSCRSHPINPLFCLLC